MQWLSVCVYLNERQQTRRKFINDVNFLARVIIAIMRISLQLSVVLLLWWHSIYIIPCIFL